MKWIKRICNRHSHPDIRAVGFWGVVVFDELCAIAGEFDLDGEIPAKYADPKLIADRTMASSIRGGVQRCAAVMQVIAERGLIEIRNDGSVSIPGWASIQGDTGASRQQRKREKDRMSRDGHVSVTPCHGLEESRVEEKRDLNPISVLDMPDSPRGEPVPLALLSVESDPDALTPDRLAERWNREVIPEDEKGRVRIPLGKAAKHAAARIRERPRPRDWDEILVKARQLRAAGCTWLDFGWLVGSPDHPDNIANGKYDFRLERARARDSPAPASDFEREMFEKYGHLAGGQT